MARFYLLGLVAVALAIQAPSLSLAHNNPPSDCRSEADKTQMIPGYSQPCEARAHIPHDVAYFGLCLCVGKTWWTKYDTCLKRVTDPSWKTAIAADRQRRCNDCSQEFPPSPSSTYRKLL
ncbi:BQ5605_C026g10164 [Microbotryum silenes-dioicae]|uniref:BQ5605_C026g10164 protein n=1 Tax=Microbotryum silenes-dioicae TaxID=796604 RepID=A0A2X0MQW2_9BASI|nr:BQ5605_C026g10164 [Microbotryum silenes-dioicae]